MDTILIVGIETVVGANLAATLADRYRVVGLSIGSKISIAGCETITCHMRSSEETVREWVSSTQPKWIVYCSTAARSSWDIDELDQSDDHSIHAVCNWATAAAEFDSHLTIISSDAVFNGPWMFHQEDSDCLCTNNAARVIQSIEHLAETLCPNTLVVRTSAYGWSPSSVGSSWIDRAVSAFETSRVVTFDSVRHATPILATDLASILERALQKSLTGIYHVAGAERVNPAQFVQELANQLGLTLPGSAANHSLSQRPTDFCAAETSLHTKKIRKALGISMPMVSEGLSRLAEQRQNGYCKRLNGESETLHEQVA